MILREYEQSICGTRTRCMVVCVCDDCGIEFERQRCHVKSKLVFCSNDCLRKSRSSGKMWEHHKAVRLERYGTLDHSTSQSRKVAVAKRDATIASRYGVTNAGQIQSGIEKRKATCERRYGWQTPFQSAPSLEKAIARNTSVEVQEKREQTTLDRYGVRTVLSLPEVNALGRSSEVEARRHETLKRNGFYGKPTKPERALGDLLISTFSKVEPTVTPFGKGKRWTIDFWVIEHDCYVQLDGVYWHGLNRPEHVIAASETPRDKKIMDKIRTDREVDAWFTSEGKRLIRVTDRFVNSNMNWEVQVINTIASGHTGVIRLM